jgi:hypothetical protein
MSTRKVNDLDERGSSGKYVIRQVMRFAFFVRRPHLQIAEQAVTALGEVIDLFPPPALTMFAGPSGDWFEYDATGLKKQVSKRLTGKQQTINGNVSIAGDQANIPDFAVDYRGFALDLPAFTESASNLVLSIAMRVFDEDVRSASLQLGRNLAIELGCEAGYVDVALEGDRARRQALARRFKCIDISDVSAVSADLDDRIPGVHWINFWGSDIVKKLGGRAKVSSGLSQNARVDDLEGGGLLISLGSSPELGDVNQRPNLADWKYLANLARASDILHVPRKVKYFRAEEDASGLEAQERWHLRFVDR